jgi:hypothetical protein
MLQSFLFLSARTSAIKSAQTKWSVFLQVGAGDLNSYIEKSNCPMIWIVVISSPMQETGEFSEILEFYFDGNTQVQPCMIFVS